MTNPVRYATGGQPCSCSGPASGSSPRETIWAAHQQLGRLMKAQSTSARNVPILQLFQIAKVLERFWIRERVRMPYSPTVNNVAHRKLRDFPVDRPRNVRNLHNLLRHVMGRGVL